MSEQPDRPLPAPPVQAQDSHGPENGSAAAPSAPAARRIGGQASTGAVPTSEPSSTRQRKPKQPSGLRATPILLTLSMVAIAGLLGWAVWDAYLIAPWTRDATVRAYVVTEASEVAGRLVSLPVRADGFVRRGQLLMEIEPTDYQIAVANAEADVEQAQASLANSKAQDARRRELTTLSTSVEEKQNFATQVQTAEATLRRNLATLAQARVNLKRTRITASVNGFVTNLDAQVGDYVTVGERVISIVNSDSFWVDAYFEETQLSDIHLGDRARLYLMGWKQPLWGHVSGISRGIEVQNAQADSAGLASVNPVFTWIRLAQRIPVRIALDQVPPDVILSAGMTATVQLNPHTGHGVSVLKAVLSGQRPNDVPPPLPEDQAVAPAMSPAPPPMAVPKGGVITSPAGQTTP